MIIYYVTILTKSHSLFSYLSDFFFFSSQQCFNNYQSFYHSCLLSEKRNNYKMFLIEILKIFDAPNSSTFRYNVLQALKRYEYIIYNKIVFFLEYSQYSQFNSIDHARWNLLSKKRSISSLSFIFFWIVSNKLNELIS